MPHNQIPPPMEERDPAPLFPVDNLPFVNSTTKPLTETSSLKIYLHLAEPVLYLQGFDAPSIASKPPALLRGSLIVRVLKPTKMKSISMLLKGTARTEWPEGLPPKNSEFHEEHEFLKHGWGFWSSGDEGYGADLVKALSNDEEHEEHEEIARGSSALSLIKRVSSPSPSRGDTSSVNGRQRSSSILSSLSIPGSTSTPHANPVPTSTPERDSNGNITFPPGEYHYSFEHAIPCSSPETISCSYGSIRYELLVSLNRPGAFKSNIHTTRELKVVRLQCEDSVEDSEPITISRDWEGHLLYDMVIFSKSIVLNAFIPMSFCLKPTEKIKLHRIRVYLTESTDYYTKNRKIHRNENSKKILLMEKRAPPPPDLPPDADSKEKKKGNLLSTDGYDLCAKEFDFLVYVPQTYAPRTEFHPNTFNPQIKIHHWIKICLRLSRMVDGKYKHYEISIDSPIHVMDPLASHANTLLPSYNGLNLFESGNGGTNHKSNTYFPDEVINNPPVSPDEAVLNSNKNDARINGIYDSLQEALGMGSVPVSLSKPMRYQTLKHPRAESELSSNHFLDAELISTVAENIEHNVYKPEKLDMKLTSPQAIPLSPATSPAPYLHLGGSNDFDLAPPSFEEDQANSTSITHALSSPSAHDRLHSSSFGNRSRSGSNASHQLGVSTSPVPFPIVSRGTGLSNIREQLRSVSPGPSYHHNNIHSDVMSLNSMGSGGTFVGFGGIDSIMNNSGTGSTDVAIPGNNEGEQDADIRSLVSYRSLSPRPQSEITMGKDGLPELPPSYDEFLVEESRSPLLDGIGESTVIPRIDIVRPSVSPAPIPQPSTASDSYQPEISDHDDITSGFHFSGGSASMPASVLRSTSPSAQRVRENQRSRVGSPRASLEMARGISGGLLGSTENYNEHGDDGDDGANDLISRVSSISPRVSLDVSHSGHMSQHHGRVVDNNLLMDDTIYTTPLLPTSSQFSNGFNRSATPSNVSLPYGANNESQESFDMNRRESCSVDITALYSPTSPRNPYYQRNMLSINGLTEEEQATDENDTTRTSDETRQSSHSVIFSVSDSTLSSAVPSGSIETAAVPELKHDEELRTLNSREVQRAG
ncbi:hypothetical protein WICPIJ_009906 [Wickerhamomyces pijperi]|uniref:Arrestin C-terminal-like domain-containing protein n=1 Tax=Wickerhamomyces pijperi TaxID=599730 RepID=A0A9P8TBY6_WICPI|nr:hypothetical protein WICPIJ_009906 [Wickerhamomyces pijperi]